MNLNKKRTSVSIYSMYVVPLQAGVDCDESLPKELEGHRDQPAILRKYDRDSRFMSAVSFLEPAHSYQSQVFCNTE